MNDVTEVDVVCARLVEILNPEELVDMLGLTTEELVEALRSHIADNVNVFEDVL
jgi:hypothetical protein